MREITLLSFLFCFSLSVSSQVKISGKIAIGDTAQVHVLHTVSGDRLLGRVAAWKGDSLIFLQNGRNEAGYRLEQIAQISVWEGNPLPAEQELFILEKRDGKTYSGYLVSMGKTMLKFKSREEGIIRIKPEEVEAMYPEALSGKAWKNFANDYRFTDEKGKKTEGKITGISDGKLHFETRNGKTSTSSLQAVRMLRFLKSHQPMFGYRRSSMFAPTGFNLLKNQVEFRNIGYFFHNSIGYGLSDNLSLTGGMYGLLPVLGAKASYSIGQFVHLSSGAFAVAGISFGAHASVSLGTPDYFFNACYVRNTDYPFNSDLNFTAVSYGVSVRTGRRSRFFGEYIYLNENMDEFGGFSATPNGRKNTFTWGVSFFGKKTRLEVGMMLHGPPGFCFPEPCTESYRVLPVVSGGATFFRQKKN